MSSLAVRDGSRAWLRPVVVIVLSIVALVAVAAPVDPVIRFVALLPFMIFGPGLGLVGLLGIRDAWRELSLVIGVSLSVDLVVASALVYGGNRSAGVALAVLIGVAVAGAVGQAARRARGTEAAA